jgi:hypothetical protein
VPLEVRQRVHVVVERLRPAAVNVLEEALELHLRLAGEEDDAEVDRLFQLRGQLLQHGDAAADVEAADGDVDALLAELARDRHCAGELVRLHADETDKAAMAGLADLGRDLLDRNPDVHLVIGVDLDRDILAEDLAGGAVLRDRVE